jgi:hypothetical protein
MVGCLAVTAALHRRAGVVVAPAVVVAAPTALRVTGVRRAAAVGVASPAAPADPHAIMARPGALPAVRSMAAPEAAKMATAVSAEAAAVVSPVAVAAAVTAAAGARAS